MVGVCKDPGGKWYVWDASIVFCAPKILLSFNYGDCRTVHGFCATDGISGYGAIYQEIFANGVFHLRDRRTPKALLEVLSFVRYFNFLFTEELLVSRYCINKRSV